METYLGTCANCGQVYITVREEAKDVLAKMQREQEIEREKIL